MRSKRRFQRRAQKWLRHFIGRDPSPEERDALLVPSHCPWMPRVEELAQRKGISQEAALKIVLGQCRHAQKMPFEPRWQLALTFEKS